MTVVFTNTTRQITPDLFASLHGMGSQLLGEHVHVVPTKFHSRLQNLYSDADPGMADDNGNLFYLGHLRRDLGQVGTSSGISWATLVHSLGKHFIHDKYVEIRVQRERFEGLPFFDLMFMSNPGVIIGTEAVKRISASFDNIHQDGGDEDFLLRMERERPDTNIAEMFWDLRHKVSLTAAVDGSMIYTGSDGTHLLSWVDTWWTA